MADCSPGNNPHADQPNFTLGDYFAMVDAGEAEFSITEVSRILGVSRVRVQRMLYMATVPEEIFEEELASAIAGGRRVTTTGFVDRLRRRTGAARASAEVCPNCGHVLRERRR